MLKRVFFNRKEQSMNKKLILICPLILLLFSGCGSGGASTGVITGTIAGAGALLQETFAGAEADLERARLSKLAELEAANLELENITDEVKRVVAQAKIKALEKKVQNLTDIQMTAKLAKAGTKIDWSDPAAVGGFGSTVIMSVLAYLSRKKFLKESRKRSAERTAKEKTLKELAALPAVEITAPIIEAMLFTNTGIERANQKVA